MAQSTLKHPRALMRELAREYQIADEDEVLAFLERHPDAAPLLFDIRSNIRRYFGDDAVRLDMSYDLEWPEDGPEMVANIQTPLRSADAIDSWRQLGRDWWFKKRGETAAPILVSFEHVRRV
ncbi:MAG: hypothetical protein H0V00_06715 [Chloroflexia bacterium]|nr:hypothetical protein [Chloroflexia bacterium]